MRIARDPHVAFAALAELKQLLAEVAGRSSQSLSLNTPVLGAASEARDQNRGNAHAHQSRRHATDHEQVRQLDLFDLSAPAGFEQPVPSWRVLPEDTCRAVTAMLARLLLDHGGVDRRPIRTEAVDDV
jgi:hypothetical protein